MSWDTLDAAVQYVSNKDKTGGQLNPTWVEWLMGYPLGWLNSALLGMPLFRNARALSTKKSPKESNSVDPLFLDTIDIAREEEA